MITGAARHELIIRDLKQAIQSGGSPLLLTGRSEHLEEFASRLHSVVPSLSILRGGMGRRQRRIVLESLAAVLFDDDDRPQAQAARRSIVAPAQRSAAAKHKALTNQTADGLPVHSFQTLLSDLATIVKNRIQPADEEHPPSIYSPIPPRFSSAPSISWSPHCDSTHTAL